MGLRSLNREYGKKPLRVGYFAAGVVILFVVVAFAYVFFSLRDVPEETTTTSAMPMTSTTKATTVGPSYGTTTKATSTGGTSTTAIAVSKPTSTTTTLAIACHQNSDCGIQVEQRICYLGDVYLKRISPLCKKPGKSDSYCVKQESWATGSIVAGPIPQEKCNKKCVNGTCTSNI